MEGVFNKMEQMEKSLLSNLQETRSLLIDQLKQINEKIDSQIGAKVEQVPGESDYDLNPFVIYEKCEWVGGGASGSVYQVCDKGTKDYFVMKCVPLDDRNIIPPNIGREMSLLNDLKHVNIVKLKKVYSYRSHLYLLMEDAGTDLYQFLKCDVRKKVTAGVIKDLVRQLLSALDYLHKRGIVHRDLKPENICIDNDLRLRICDFGSARRPGDGDDVRVLTPRVGTLLFMAPEMLMGDEAYGEKIDMWSAGCIFYEMVVKKNPFSIPRGHSSWMSVLYEIFRKIGKPKEGSVLFSLRDYPDDEPEYRGQQDEASDVVPIPGHVPGLDADGNDLLKKLLAVDPDDRITAREALNHPYFKVDTGAAADVETAERIPKRQRQTMFHDHASDSNIGL